MAGWHLDTKMAQDIVARTMTIIDTNINVMDARGRMYRQRRSGAYRRAARRSAAGAFAGARGGY